jgi:hypothetical protein
VTILALAQKSTNCKYCNSYTEIINKKEEKAKNKITHYSELHIGKCKIRVCIQVQDISQQTGKKELLNGENFL